MHTGPTSGLAPGYAQANLVVLPQEDALDFLRFCVRNPGPCPLLEVTDTGSPHPDGARRRRRSAHRHPALPRVARRRVHRRADRHLGVLARRSGGVPAGLLVHLRMGAGRRWTAAGASGCRASTSRCTSPTAAASAQGPSVGRWSSRCARSHRTTSPASIGDHRALPRHARAPVHVGDPAALGIAEPRRPDFGDPVAIGADEVPVFWACGVTPQVVAQSARPSLAIFHSPGHMFITDRDARSLRLPSRATEFHQPGGQP